MLFCFTMDMFLCYYIFALNKEDFLMKNIFNLDKLVPVIGDHKIYESYEKVFNTFVLPQIELCLGKVAETNKRHRYSVDFYKDDKNNIVFAYYFHRPASSRLCKKTIDKITKQLNECEYEFDNYIGMFKSTTHYVTKGYLL